MLFIRQTLKAMGRRKTLLEAKGAEEALGEGPLLRSLTGIDLILYGVGSSVGAGIYVMVGLGAHVAGPAISLSFLSCGSACILTSLAYAEFAARIPVAGSAYTYVYVAFGEIFAWCVAWFLILGYGFTASVVARAWADYFGDLLMKIFRPRGWKYTTAWLQRITEWEIIGDGKADEDENSLEYSFSLLSMVIIGVNTWILLKGVSDSAVFNNVMTITNISVLALVIVTGLSTESVNVENLTPFVPHHVASIVQGAGLVFFAFIGFDMVASLSEEVVSPERNMPIGIVGSLISTTFIYVTVSLVVVGMAPVKLLGQNVPIINSLLVNAYCSHEEQLLSNATAVCFGEGREASKAALAIAARIVDTGAIFGLTNAVFTSLMGQPRIFYRMAQDGLFFRIFAEVDPVSQVPRFGIILTGVVTAFLACFVPLDALANLISLGTLMVFTFVDAGVILLRVRTQPDLPHSNKKRPTKAERIKRKASHNQETKTVALLLVTYTAALVCASVFFTNTTRTILIVLCICLAAISVFFIVITPRTWKTEADNAALHEHQFLCPLVPGVPLAGMACNAFMMGSLPSTSWLFCLMWLALGLAFYFCYGIHHSALQHNNRYLEGKESAPLVALEDWNHGKDEDYDSFAT